ncbi:MAG: trigger factor [Patescibacteria group bacterium]
MNFSKNELPKSLLEIVVTLPFPELEPYLKKTAEQISQTKKIEGFRPGKAPYEIVLREVGEMFLIQNAANMAIEDTLDKILESEKIDAISEPKIEVQKLAPNNEFIFKATFSLLPKMTILSLDKLKVKLPEEIKIEEKEIDKVLEDLKKYKAKEVLADKIAETGDKVIMTLNVFVDNVPIEGGQTPNHSVIIGENLMIPGFEDNIKGLKVGDAKEFDLEFPKKYHEEKLAGKPATFKIKVTEIYKIELPELNDEFAKAFGLQTMPDLRKNIESNLKREKEAKENQKFELDILETLQEKSEFGEIPEVLVNEETHRMVHELEENVAKQGMNFEDYLKHLKKTEADMMLDFIPDALKRVKTGLLIREIAKNENIAATEEELKTETERTIASYKLNPQYESRINEIETNLKGAQAQQYFGNIIKNRKTLDFLKNKARENSK